MRRRFWGFFCFGLCVASGLAAAQRAAIPPRTRDPYVGAIVVDALDGTVLFEDRADEPGYPASMLKLMDLLLILEDADAGRLKLTDPVRVDREAAGMGGSQVWLKEGETFPIEDLLYAIMVQSANDAAVALAIHVSGTVPGFVQRMNERAKQLGMSRTVFCSVHGLPPAAGQQPDVTTARDFARLCVHLARRTDVFRFTATAVRGFRNDTLVMRTHNNLLGAVAGCDGFKTGFFTAAGYSIAATAARDGGRAIAVVLGSPSKAVRDTKARELLSMGLAAARRPTVAAGPAASSTAGAPPLPAATDAAPPATAPPPPPRRSRLRWLWIALGAATVAMVVVYRRQQWGR